MRYPSFNDEFIRTMREHILKANNPSSSSSTKNHSTAEDNNSQLVSSVVKLRI